jgi:aryl sulfotransferase
MLRIAAAQAVTVRYDCAIFQQAEPEPGTLRRHISGMRVCKGLIVICWRPEARKPEVRVSGLVKWPAKTREIRNRLCDSTRWNEFPFRDGDVVVATYAKTGTTWTQQIVGQLIFRGAPGASFDASPWVDFRPIPLDEVIEKLEAQQHRRFLKTHLPIDALVYSPKARYLYIVRDGRDVAWSFYNHLVGFTPEFYAMVNSDPELGPPMVPPGADIVQYFHEWIRGGAIDMGASFWENVQVWWDARNLRNLLLVHFNDLKADLPGQMRRIADFLGIEIEEDRWGQMVEHCGLDYMRNAAAAETTFVTGAFVEGAKTFFNRGTNGRWKEMLSAADLEAYEQIVKASLSPECARWMATGELAG